MVRVFPRGLCRANGGKRVKHVRAVKELLETTNSDCFILFYVFQVIIVDYTYIYIYYNYIFYIYIHSIYIRYRQSSYKSDVFCTAQGWAPEARKILDALGETSILDPVAAHG